MKKIIILLLTIFLTSGCSYVELNDLAVASVLGIDYDNENNNFNLTAQVMNVKNSSEGSTEEGTLIYEASGKTIAKAIRNFGVRYPKNVYLGHLEFIILNKNVASKINDIFDYIMRSPEVRSSAYVAITKEDSAKEILKPNNEVKDSFPVESLKTVLLDAKERTGTIYDLTLEEFLSFYLKKGIDPLVPIIKNEDKKGMRASSIVIEDLAPFKNKTLGKELNEIQSISYSTLNNYYKDIVMETKYKNTYIGSVIYNPKSKIDLNIKDNNIKVNLDVNIESKIIEIGNKENLLNKESEKEIKGLISNTMKKNIESLITYSKKENTDILGLKSIIYKNYNNKYSEYKDKNIYELADFNINVNNKMYRFGNINKGA